MAYQLAERKKGHPLPQRARAHTRVYTSLMSTTSPVLVTATSFFFNDSLTGFLAAKISSSSSSCGGAQISKGTSGARRLPVNRGTRNAYSTALGLGNEPPNDKGLNGVLHGEDDVGLPADSIERNGPGKLVQEATQVDGQRGEGHALGTHLERQNFDREKGLERRDTNRVNATKGESD